MSTFEITVNLWVDVQGERYEADRLAQGGSFHADMGYATFGGDVALTPTTRAGLVVQYADGTLRSDSLQAKNDYNSYGVSFYGSWQPVEWGKLVTEVAYVKGTNGIEAPRQALVSDVDTSMLSFGVRAQYQGSLGNFSIVPSIGLRVSRLETDALKFGTVSVEDDAQTLVQLPIALRATAKPMDVASWTLAPSFKVAYVPTFGDKEYTFRGTKATVIDTAPVQGALGVRAMKGGFMLDADLMLGGGKQGTNSVGARVGARYTF
ncbi:MAG: autotransporter outer membrane beta-barrel domain-containing protein [Sutterella sp.]|nr:autotransporter outer membrane beta-barrel domain-containing protein [Sutterella sp.]